MRTEFTAALAVLAVITGLSSAVGAANQVQTVPIEPPTRDSETDQPGLPGLGDTALPEVSKDIDALPGLVQRTREAIMEAAQSGDIGRMLPVIEQSEFPPAMGQEQETDLIAYMRGLSGDAEGREILAILLEILEAGYAHVEPGTSREAYVWPYFAAIPFAALTPEQEVDLFRIITPMDKEDMAGHAGQYTFFRLGIGPDGTWYFLLSGD